MDEKQMLLMAAKAAGDEFGIGYDEHITGPYIIDGHGFPVAWNPIHDDGDAFRLAMKMDLRVSVRIAEWPAPPGELNCVVVDAHEEADRHAATRLAIVRAAAAIGERSNG